MEWVSYPLDLALLKVNDKDLEKFNTHWNKHISHEITFSDVIPPKLQDVIGVGFPQGGTQINPTLAMLGRFIVTDDFKVLNIEVKSILPLDSGATL